MRRIALTYSQAEGSLTSLDAFDDVVGAFSTAGTEYLVVLD